jgi:nickel-dependent lactate racemase
MIYFQKGSTTDDLTLDVLRQGLFQALGQLGERRKVLALPPDITRFHSQAGPLTEWVWEYYQEKLTDVLPAIGSHYPMCDREIDAMFGGVPRDLFRVHDWRKGLATLGEVPSSFVSEVSGGLVEYGIPIQVDTLLTQGQHDLILSIGQVVPHEVVGMANYNKNVFVGTGGADGIHKTHFLGAVYGMERIMGRAHTPVRRVLNYGSDHFARHLPIIYVLTVVGKDPLGRLVVRGLFIGDDVECFQQAAELSLKVNFELLVKPIRKAVVYLDPSEFRSTWLGNKSIYRTRMAIADGGELIVLAPGVSEFGEDPGIDGLIRKYGYTGTPNVLDLVKKNEDLRQNLSAAAHLIHGSSENRFTITYCPGKMTRDEIESVHFRYARLETMLDRYDPGRLKDGFQTMPDGEEIFYISNPALGLWAYKGRFS